MINDRGCRGWGGGTDVCSNRPGPHWRDRVYTQTGEQRNTLEIFYSGVAQLTLIKEQVGFDSTETGH